MIKATLQVNDHNADGTIAVGQQIGNTDNSSVLTLGAPIIIAVPEPEPVPDEPAPVVLSEPVHSAQTGDITILVMLGLIAAGSVAASALKVSKKKI